MNGRKIKVVGSPVDVEDVANKNYVDNENAKQDIAIADKANKSYVDGEIAKVNIDTTPLLPRNGSRNMFGDLDMDGNHILSVENLVDYKDVDPYEYRVKDLKSVVNKEFLNEKFLKKVDKDGREYYDLKQIVIKNSAPHDDGSYDNNTLVSKAFVDAEISKLPKPATNVLKLDGSKKMAGNLDMGGFYVDNIRTIIEDDGGNPNYDQIKYKAINFEFLKKERDELVLNSSKREAKLLPKDGSEAMTGALNMNNHQINYLPDPTGSQQPIPLAYGDDRYLKRDGSKAMDGDINLANNFRIINSSNPQADTDLVTKKYMETYVNHSHVTSSDRSDVFQYIMNDWNNKLLVEDEIKFHGLVTYQSSPHLINKTTLDTRIGLDLGDGYYSSRFDVDIYTLLNGSYTLVYELIWSSVDVDPNTVTLNCQSDHNIPHSFYKTFNNYSRMVTQITKSSDIPPNYLYIDVTIKMKIGRPYPPILQLYSVFYGVKGHQSDVPSKVYDALWAVENGKVTFNEGIDMGNHVITGLKSAILPTEAINYQQLLQHLNNIKIKTHNHYEELFEYWFDCLDPDMFNYNTQSLDGMVTKINNKLILSQFQILSDFDPKDGFLLHGSYIQLDKNYLWNDDFTLFIVFKHDTSFTQDDQYFGFGSSSAIFPPYVKMTADKMILYKTLTPDTYTEKTLYSFQKNQYLMIWFTKTGNTYKVDLCDDSLTILESITPVKWYISDRVHINFRYRVQRIGLSLNFHDVDDIDFHKITFLEKSKGTYFD